VGVARAPPGGSSSGRVHVSVPFGHREDLGWLRQLDRGAVDELFERAGAGRREEFVYAYTSQGWRRSSFAAAADASYETMPSEAPDKAAAARAVLCATIQA